MEILQNDLFCIRVAIGSNFISGESYTCIFFRSSNRLIDSMSYVYSFITKDVLIYMY